MNEFEDQLKALRLAAPSSNLERRMESTFSSAQERARQKPQPKPPTWWWLAVVSAGSVAALLFVSPPPARLQPTTSPEVYRFEAQGLMREMLLNSNPGQPEAPFNIQVHEP